jgi:polyphosphate glucokinase
VTTVLGIDVGGTGIKAAVVDTEAGVCTGEKRSAPTPQPATPEAVIGTMAELARDFTWQGPVGIGYSGVVKAGVMATAANLDDGWVGFDALPVLSDRLGASSVTIINDADAAGLAEMRFGAGEGIDGLVVMVTLGTGIGTSIFYNGVHIPNSELGPLSIDGMEAEDLTSARAKTSHDLTWEHWSGYLAEFMGELERLLWPDLFVIGSGISAEFHAFCDAIRSRTPSVAARLGNDAGIIGAALPAAALLSGDGSRP